jgi:hypothetical protein
MVTGASERRPYRGSYHFNFPGAYSSIRSL